MKSSIAALCLLAALSHAFALAHDDSPGTPIATRHYEFRGEPRKAVLFKNEPKICDDVQQYSGYFTLGDSDKKYFYWFFESRQNASTDPTIMWLTGGPGCSSMLALFTENGPCTIKEDGVTTVKNDYSWNNKSNIIFVDQPPGTGFSEGSDDHNEKQVAEDMYQFLQAFFGAYPKYNKKFFVFGESYAGHYVPAISHRIFVGNQNKTNPEIKLEGLAIGNGLTDPEVQYKYYAQMAYNSTTAPSVIGRGVYDAMRVAQPGCIELIKGCQISRVACTLAFALCNVALTTPVTATGINPYDMRIPCEYGRLCYNFTNVDAYLNRDDVQKEIGVNKKWEECNMLVNERFKGDWMKNYQTELPDLLHSGIRVLIYAGDVDFICNWLGNKAWTLELEWEGKDGFNKASDNIWKYHGDAGKLRKYKNFSFLQVFEAGHMVPRDQPERALHMTNSFIVNIL